MGPIELAADKCAFDKYPLPEVTSGKVTVFKSRPTKVDVVPSDTRKIIVRVFARWKSNVLDQKGPFLQSNILVPGDRT